MTPPSYDVGIIGAGLVGLSTARALHRLAPDLRLVLLEKESGIGTHQSGHNSGVVHSGIYYRPGSLKATLCVEGRGAMLRFCEEQGIRVQFCGKVIVALSAQELPRLEELHRRGIANRVESLSRIGPERLKEIEPHARGIAALHLPKVAVVDFRRVAQALGRILEKEGVEIKTSSPVLRIQPSPAGFVLETPAGEISVRHLISCAGLQADRIAKKAGLRPDLQILPFRGEYYELVPEKRSLVRGLLYPVPDPRFPFLGVHLSVRIDGRVEAGPNAVLAFQREGYRKTDVNLRDLQQMALFPGFWRMTARTWQTGLEEMFRSLSKPAFTRSIQRLVPEILPADLVPGSVGVRAQAVNRRGELLDDFHLLQEGRSLHVCNAPSPAATASLAIGDHIATSALRQFNLT